MYIKHSVSLIGTGGLVWLSVVENLNKTETMYIKHGFSPFDRYARPPVPINDTLCLMYIGSASLGFSPFDRYVRPPVPIHDSHLSKRENPNEGEPMYIKHSVSLIGTGGLAYLSKGKNPNEGGYTVLNVHRFCFSRVLSL
jgi:hypothetical protein